MKRWRATLGRLRDAAPVTRDGWTLAAGALALRLALVLASAGRFPPIADGYFYHVVAQRIAKGLGYTWLWPDGAVTYAAHYPVGYPAIVGTAYALVGPHPWAAMTVNAFVGAWAVLAVHRLTSTVGSRLAALMAATLTAVHPALVFYTPALMTEGVTASLYVVVAAAWLRPELSDRRRLLTGGLATGIATLVRPQALLLAPVLAALGGPGGIRRRFWRAAIATGLAIGVCLPWTVRNCERMGRCMLVSANGGWNLFIGAAPGATGSWVALEELGCPSECRNVFDEAEKDRCFGLAALHHILREPGRWLSLIPSKLESTFDYGGAPGWYLHESNPGAFGERAKFWLGATETLYQRLVALLAVWAVIRIRRGSAPFGSALLWIVSASFLTRSAWIGYVGLAVAIALLGRRVTQHPPAAAVLAVLATTAIVHAVFFGAGRYSLVCYPVLCSLAGCVVAPSRPLRPREQLAG